MPTGSEPCLTILENIETYAPEPLGRMNVLIAGGVVAQMQREPLDPGGLEAEVISGAGRLLVPGFIDAHVHLLGGGGEGGYATRTPEIMLSDLTLGGVTTVVGCLGTDAVTRSPAALLAKARGLEAEGVTAHIYTGSYQVPLRTFTGSVQDDLVLIDKVLGVGELAISDHRSSQPTFEEFVRIAAAARVGGMISGKAGVLNIHVGAGDRMLELIERTIEGTEIPARHFVPTHVNRNPRLLAAGIAYARGGGGRGRYIDLTTSHGPDAQEFACASALPGLLAAGVSVDSISFSSDGQGSMPRFGAGGETTGLGVGRSETLFQEVRSAVRNYGVPLEDALRVITSTPAAYLGLPGKGRIRPGADADLVLLDRDLAIDTVLARGRCLVRAGELRRLGTFEQDLLERFEAKRRHLPPAPMGQ